MNTANLSNRSGIRILSLLVALTVLLCSCVSKEKDLTHDEKVTRFRDENPSLEIGQTVFIGDSITEHYKLKRYYRNTDPKCYNRGISGDTTDWMIARLQTSLFDIYPAKVVLMIGTNDINAGKSADEIAVNYEIILSLFSQNIPDAEVICVSIIPQNKKYSDKARENNERIKSTNLKIEALCQDFGYEYVNLYDHLTDSKGMLMRRYTHDGLHLSQWGYRVWTDVMKDKI